MDEMDTLLQSIKAGKEDRWANIVRMLLSIYSTADREYNMRIKAGREHKNIDQPGLTIFGTAIPKCLYEAMSVKMLINGFFGRLLILEAGKRGEGQEPKPRPLPESIVKAADWWAKFRPGEERGNLDGWHPRPHVVDQTLEAMAVFLEFRKSTDREYAAAEARDDEAGMSIWARAREKAHRLALNYACSVSHASPVVDEEAAAWACEFARHQTARMLFMAGAHVSENEFDGKCKRCVDVLRKWRDRHGDEWMPAWQLKRKLKGWTPRDIDDVRKTLIGQGRIEPQTVTHDGSGRIGEAYRLR